MDLDVTVTPPGASASTGPTYVEPYVGGRVTFFINEKWSLGVRGNAGGFGIRNGSNLTWTVTGGAMYRPWDLVTFGLGYRVYDIDYDNGNRDLQMRMQGPGLSATFHL